MPTPPRRRTTSRSGGRGKMSRRPRRTSSSVATRHAFSVCNAVRLMGKTAIVTGGGSGIGRAYSERLAREGAQVAVADIDLDAAKSIAAKLDGEGLKAHAFPVDIASDASVRE